MSRAILKSTARQVAFKVIFAFAVCLILDYVQIYRVITFLFQTSLYTCEVH